MSLGEVSACPDALRHQHLEGHRLGGSRGYEPRPSPHESVICALRTLNFLFSLDALGITWQCVLTGRAQDPCVNLAI